MRALSHIAALMSSTCGITAEGENEEHAAGGGSAEVTNLEGGASRIEVKGTTDDAARNYRAATGEEAPKEGEQQSGDAEGAKGAEGEASKEEAPKVAGDFDFKGTIFDGISPELQGKVAPFAAVFAENGTLTDAEVEAAVAQTGFSAGMIRQFMKGAEVEAGATSAAQTAALYQPFGGEDGFKAFQAWTMESKDGAPNITKAEEDAINSLIDAGNAEAAASLLKPLIDRFQAAGGGAPARDITSGGREQNQHAGANSGVQPFQSMAQQVAAMEDPRYDKDPAYRREVEQRVSVSTY